MIPSTHYLKKADKLAKELNRNLRKRKIIIDIGGTAESGWYRHFSQNIKDRITMCNLPDYDARDLPFKNESIDAILCFGILEHVWPEYESGGLEWFVMDAISELAIKKCDE